MSGKSKASCKQEPGAVKPVVDLERCEGKADCVRVCPENVFEIRRIAGLITGGSGCCIDSNNGCMACRSPIPRTRMPVGLAHYAWRRAPRGLLPCPGLLDRRRNLCGPRSAVKSKLTNGGGSAILRLRTAVTPPFCDTRMTFFPRLLAPGVDHFFLLGPRGTGKTLWCAHEYPDALRVDLLNIVLEVQLSSDEDKRYAWPAYVANLRARIRCPVCLLVIAADEGVARWACKAIELGGGNRCYRGCWVHQGYQKLPTTNGRSRTLSSRFCRQWPTGTTRIRPKRCALRCWPKWRASRSTLSGSSIVL